MRAYKSASSVSRKWVKSNEHREREKERRRAKVSVNNGQYKRQDQKITKEALYPQAVLI